jgi:hypothetical protein
MKRDILTGKLIYDAGFPQYSYHKVKGAKLFNSQAELDEAGEGWLDNSGKHLESTHKEFVPSPESKLKKVTKEEVTELEKESDSLKEEVKELKKKAK